MDNFLLWKLTNMLAKCIASGSYLLIVLESYQSALPFMTLLLQIFHANNVGDLESGIE
jgi:hypothetical protein